jgi:IS30 family transposase
MKIAFGLLAAQYPMSAIRSATVGEGKNSPVTENWNDCTAWVSISPARTHPGNETPTKIPSLGRELISKGHNFAQVTDADLGQALALINNRPRKT